MKRVLLITILGLLVLNCFSQDVNNKYLIGASVNYSHDDLTNNQLLVNYFHFDQNYSNSFEFLSEFGYFLTQNSILGIDVGYISSGSKQKRSGSGSNSDLLNSKSIGISLNPKYKFMKRFSDKIWFTTDFKIVFQYVSHQNKVSQLDLNTYQFEYLNINGTEFKYGLAINPGLIFKINKSFGLKIDYQLVDVLHSAIKNSDGSDVDLDYINAWDYRINMKLSGLNLGIIFTL